MAGTSSPQQETRRGTIAALAGLAALSIATLGFGLTRLAILARQRRGLAITLLVTPGLVASLAILALLAELHEQLISPAVREFDTVVTQAIHGPTSPWLTNVALAATWLGSPTVLIVVALLTTLVAFLLRRWQAGVGAILSVTGAALLTLVLKLGFHRERPTVSWAILKEADFSFPSGHAAISLAVYGMVGFLLWHTLRHGWLRMVMLTLVVALIGLIGLSRIYLGVHYPSDIVAGYLTGSVWLITSIAVARLLALIYPRRDVATEKPATKVA